MPSRLQPLATALIATLGLSIGMVLAFDFATGETWLHFPLSKAGLTDEYCERNHFEAFIRQPVNAWSNLCYFFLGVWMLVVGVQDARSTLRRNALERFPAMTIWMALTLIGLCFGSFFFHASVTRVGQHWDMAFTYALSLSLVAAGGYRWVGLLGGGDGQRMQIGWLTAAIAAAGLMYVFKWRIEGKIALPILLLLGLLLVIALYLRLKGKLDGRMLLAGVAMLILSLICRSLDLAKIGCDPDGLLQLHAAWHLCTGLAAFLFWHVLHAEKP
jgi:hypothetical protein